MKAGYPMHEFTNCPPTLSPISQFLLNMYKSQMFQENYNRHASASGVALKIWKKTQPI